MVFHYKNFSLLHVSNWDFIVLELQGIYIFDLPMTNLDRHIMVNFSRRIPSNNRNTILCCKTLFFRFRFTHSGLPRWRIVIRPHSFNGVLIHSTVFYNPVTHDWSSFRRIVLVYCHNWTNPIFLKAFSVSIYGNGDFRPSARSVLILYFHWTLIQSTSLSCYEFWGAQSVL